MRSDWYAITLNIAYQTSTKSHFGWVEMAQNEFAETSNNLELWILDGTKNIFPFYTRHKMISKRNEITETVLRPRQICNLSFSEGKQSLFRACLLFKNRFLDLEQVAFSVSNCHKSSYYGQAIPWLIVFSNSTKSHLTRQGMWTTRIITFPTSPKSHFILCRRQKMMKHGLAITWNISFSILGE